MQYNGEEVRAESVGVGVEVEVEQQLVKRGKHTTFWVINTSARASKQMRRKRKRERYSVTKRQITAILLV